MPTLGSILTTTQGDLLPKKSSKKDLSKLLICNCVIVVGSTLSQLGEVVFLFTDEGRGSKSNVQRGVVTCPN